MRLVSLILCGQFIGMLSGCGVLASFTDKKKSPSSKAVLNLDGKRTFKDCSEIQAYISSQASARVEDGGNPVMSAPSSPASASMGVGGATNVQETGVDESDVVKVGQDAIYIQRTKDIVVLKRSTKEELGRLSLLSHGNEQMYLTDARLITVGGDPAGKSTRVDFFDVHPGTLPTLANSVTLPGSLQESRIRDGQLLLVLLDYSPDVIIDHGALSGVPCDQVVVPMASDNGSSGGFMSYGTSITKVHSLDISSGGKQTHSIGVFDYVRSLYVTADSIFMTKDGYGESGSTTYIRKIDHNAANGELSLSATGVIAGSVKDKWAFKYFADKGALVVATTSLGQGGMTNSMTTLERSNTDLVVTGFLTGFGDREDIRAVRYLNNMAYVVTFEKTDPLFAIDLSDLHHPKLMGSLEMPGFSSALYPLGVGKILGVGYDAQDMGDFSWFQGIQVSLMDVSNPANPTQLDAKIHGGRGSSSEATQDNHAVYFDSERQMIGLPVNEFGDAESHSQSEYGAFKSSGAVFYAVEDSRLREVRRVSHAEMMPEACASGRKDWLKLGWWSDAGTNYDVRRIISLDGNIYTISPFGIEVYDMGLSSLKQSVKFGDNDKECEAIVSSQARCGNW